MSTANEPPTIHVGIHGWGSWELLDERGDVIRSGGEHHNLILDQGLDQMAVYGFGAPNDDGIAAYFVVGTGATAPAAAQTGLVAEVANSRTASAPFAPTLEFVSPGVWRYTMWRELDYAQGIGNLTEWGFSPFSATANNLGVRELFRDDQGTPTPVTKTAQNKLRFKYVREYHIGPVAMTATPAFTIVDANNPIPAVTGRHLLVRNSGAEGSDLHAVNGMVKGVGYGTGISALNGKADPIYTDNLASYGYTLAATGTITEYPDSTFTTDSYVPGSFQRVNHISFPTSTGNYTHRGYVFAGFRETPPFSFTQYRWGYVFLIDAGKEYTKSDLETLRLDMVGVSWGRGA